MKLSFFHIAFFIRNSFDQQQSLSKHCSKREKELFRGRDAELRMIRIYIPDPGFFYDQNLKNNFNENLQL